MGHKAHTAMQLKLFEVGVTKRPATEADKRAQAAALETWAQEFVRRQQEEK